MDPDDATRLPAEPEAGGGVIRSSSPWWYLAAFAVAVGGWLIGTIVAAGAWEPVRDAELTSLSATAKPDGAGLAVYTDLPQPDREIRCTANGPEKGQRTPIAPLTLGITASDNGTPWSIIGFEPTMRDDVRIRCRATDDGTDSAAYAYAVVDDWDRRINAGTGIAWTAALTGLALAGWTAVARYRARATAGPGERTTR